MSEGSPPKPQSAAPETYLETATQIALALKTAADEVELAEAGSSWYLSQKTCQNCGEPGT